MSVDRDHCYERPSLPEGLLLECVVTTLNLDGGVHVSPMGPIVDQSLTSALLRPYPPSRTLDNLRRSGCCVLHITDDVDLMSRAAIGQLDQPPRTRATDCGRGAILTDACRWHLLEVVAMDQSQTPALVDCRVSDAGRLRDFTGFNRARHAVIEAAILATRLGFLPHEQVLVQLDGLAAPVEKTGGLVERKAFDRVMRFVHANVRSSDSDGGSP